MKISEKNFKVHQGPAYCTYQRDMEKVQEFINSIGEENVIETKSWEVENRAIGVVVRYYNKML